MHTRAHSLPRSGRGSYRHVQHVVLATQPAARIGRVRPGERRRAAASRRGRCDGGSAGDRKPAARSTGAGLGDRSRDPHPGQRSPDAAAARRDANAGARGSRDVGGSSIAAQAPRSACAETCVMAARRDVFAVDADRARPSLSGRGPTAATTGSARTAAPGARSAAPGRYSPAGPRTS